jgi:hypothetical protein
MDFIVIVDPSGDLSKRRLGFRKIVPLEGFDERLRHTVRFRAAHGRKARGEVQCRREVSGLFRCVGAALVREMLDRVWRSHGVKRFSRGSSIMSRTSEPLIPAPQTAVQAMISRSKASMMNAIRTTFQQENSRPSEHQRKFERMTMILPSWARPCRRPVYGAPKATLDAA